MQKNSLRFAAGIIAASTLIAPFAVGALSIQDLQAQVSALMSQITLMQTSNTTVQAGVSTSVSSSSVGSGQADNWRVCGLLNRDLRRGMRGDDISGLQEFLQSEGYFSGTATGYFGPMTARAVANWQVNEGVSRVGSVGPMTRERIKIRCGGGWGNTERFNATPTRGDAPLTVTFNTWLSAFRNNTVSYWIDFGDNSSERAADCYAPADACLSSGQNTHTYSTNGTYTATLRKITNPCGNTVECMAPVQSEVVAKQQVSVGPVACTMEYKPICGSKQIVCITTPCDPVPTTYGNRCAMNADGATFLYEGQCKDTSINPADNPQCKTWFDGCNTCSRSTVGGNAMCTLMACMYANEQRPVPYCKTYFDDTTTSNNKPPVISGFTGPTTLALNTTGTWTINASDPENGSLSYAITWGDEYAGDVLMSANARASATFVQTSTFTHVYAKAGTYTVTVVVRDSAGLSAKTSSTVKVGSEVIQCPQLYDLVCGQPKWSCPNGMTCAAVMPAPKTYSNRCEMNAAGASLLYSGQCSNPYGNNVLSGIEKIGPICPVETYPPQSRCQPSAATFAAHRIFVYATNGTTLVNTITATADGSFSAALNSGSYLLKVENAYGCSATDSTHYHCSGISSGNVQAIPVTVNGATTVNIDIDTGIR